MATINTGRGSKLGTALMDLLRSDDIRPGDEPGYQLCKTIYLSHPLGAKIVEAPINLAQSQKREISVSDGPDRVLEAFLTEWKAIAADKHIFNLFRLARIYGIASLAAIIKEDDPSKPLDFDKLYNATLAFNVFDPLNTAGSLVMNQNPNDIDFQKHTEISVQGTRYNRSRTCTILNEEPIYISYTGSAFGFVGRSVYQRALYPLKSYVQTLITNDMVQRKCGLLVAKIQQAGSTIDNVVALFTGRKRQLLKEAETDNVISIGATEEIESLNMQNLEAPAVMARTNILKDIATSADMPAKLLENETMVAGFGEGVEDAKNIARYIERFRESMQPAYDFMDLIVMHRAWTPSFFEAVKSELPSEFENLEYGQAFYKWRNSFKAQWPSLLIEPDSEKIKVEEIKYKSVVAFLEVMAPQLDPANQALLFMWAQDTINENTMLFPYQLDLDFEALEAHLEEQKQKQDDQQEASLSEATEGVSTSPKPARPFARGDSDLVGEDTAVPSAVQARLSALAAQQGGLKNLTIVKHANGDMSGVIEKVHIKKCADGTITAHVVAAE